MARSVSQERSPRLPSGGLTPWTRRYPDLHLPLCQAQYPALHPFVQRRRSVHPGLRLAQGRAQGQAQGWVQGLVQGWV